MSAKTHKDKVLIRIRPDGETNSFGFLNHTMKRGEFWKATRQQAKLLRQKIARDGKPIFEVCSLKEALSRIQKEQVKDPSIVFNAAPVPSCVNELVDLSVVQARADALRKENSFEALRSEALNSDLLLSAEDEEYLAQAIDRGENIVEAARAQATDSKISALENRVQELLSRESKMEQLMTQLVNAKILGKDAPEVDFSALEDSTPPRKPRTATPAEIEESDVIDEDEEIYSGLAAATETPEVLADMKAAVKGRGKKAATKKADEAAILKAAEEAAEKKILAGLVRESVDDDAEEEKPAKRGRGRPRKSVPKLGQQQV